jgi:glycosyltransferase involved in cell wall biosynthesis
VRSQLSGVPGVIVVGEVDDIREAYERADLVVVPIRYGSGTRVKILEAVSHGRAVVTTPAGLEGLAFVDGLELVVKAQDRDFASACVELLGSEEKRQKLVVCAHRKLIGTYTPQVVAANILPGLLADVSKTTPLDRG